MTNNHNDPHLATYAGNRHLEFRPHEDITAFELAKCMEILVGAIFLSESMGPAWVEYILTTNPELERHFKQT